MNVVDYFLSDDNGNFYIEGTMLKKTLNLIL